MNIFGRLAKLLGCNTDGTFADAASVSTGGATVVVVVVVVATVVAADVTATVVVVGGVVEVVGTAVDATAITTIGGSTAASLAPPLVTKVIFRPFCPLVLGTPF